jgi:hypothetical protein
MLQMLLEQSRRPFHGGVAQPSRIVVHEQGPQEGRQVFRPEAGASRTVVINQGDRIKRLPVMFDPVVNGASCHPQGLGDLSDGLASADFQDRQGTAIEVGIVSVLELPL